MLFKKTSSDNKPHLIVIPPQPVVVNKDDDTYYTTEKFLVGMQEYASLWPGKVTVLMYPAHVHSSNLDETEINPEKLGFNLQVIDFDTDSLTEEIKKASIVLATIDYRIHSISRICRELDKNIVLISENSLRTRLQIIDSSIGKPVMRVKVSIWEFFEELRNKATVKKASGVQCNGLPTYESYKKLNSNSLLFFDSRVRENMQTGVAQILNKKRSGKLKLVFSGRLTAIKGVIDLLEVAEILNRRGVDFSLKICGDGDLTSSMRQIIEDKNLKDKVEMEGNLDFTTELIPLVSNDCDAFVCCHPQGDPSCTYLETMSCGVPIVGYDNEAFKGVVDLSGAGWYSPIHNPVKLAGVIERLANNREEIIEHSIRSIEFASQHSFEKTFLKRNEHIFSILNN